LGSLKYLIEAGATSITYFETVGKRGVINDDKELTQFPVLEVFRHVLDKNITHVRKCNASHPFMCDALVIGNDKEEYLLVANYKDYAVDVEIKGISNNNVPLRINAMEVKKVKLG
jgi:hypothetical protein